MRPGDVTGAVEEAVSGDVTGLLDFIRVQRAVPLAGPLHLAVAAPDFGAALAAAPPVNQKKGRSRGPWCTEWECAPPIVSLGGEGGGAQADSEARRHADHK